MSGRELRAALATTTREDRAAGAGAHAQTEAMGLGATPVVRLEGALGHESLQLHRVGLACTARPGSGCHHRKSTNTQSVRRLGAPAGGHR